MSSSRFKFRVAIRQVDGSFKRFVVCSLVYSKDGSISVIYINHTILRCEIDGENAILEQCTGLKDKHGKLIYEGDVISRNNGRWKEIRFYQGGFGWWTEYDCFVSFSGHNHLEEVLQTHEIIGNIHEMELEK